MRYSDIVDIRIPVLTRMFRKVSIHSAPAVFLPSPLPLEAVHRLLSEQQHVRDPHFRWIWAPCARIVVDEIASIRNARAAVKKDEAYLS